MKSFKVVIPQTIADEGVAYLEENGCEVVMPAIEPDPEQLIELVKDCDALLIRTTEITREVIESATQLKIIARHGVGLDNVDIEAASENGVIVSNAPHANINSVAEHTVGLILAISHQMIRADKALREGDFNVRNTFIGSELKGKTVGLIGLGNIGKLVARKCALGFDMNIIAYDPFVKSVEEDYIALIDSMERLIVEADYVSLHIPYSPENHHIINEKMLKKMKRSAYFINVARGGLVDDQALYQVLKKNEIAGAGLDCFEREPTPKVYPFWELDNVIVTPHMAAHTKESMIRMAVDPAKEIVRVKNNLIPTVCVNKDLLKKRIQSI